MALPVRYWRRTLSLVHGVHVRRGPSRQRGRHRAAPGDHLPPGRDLRGILHADRGCQYTSTQLAAAELDVLLSVGRTGVRWDNARIESIWAALKTEFYDRHTFDTRAEAIHAVSSWIETVDNRRQRHGALGQVPPVAFDHRTITAAERAA